MLQLAWRVNNKRAQQLDEVSVPEGDVAVVQCNRSGKWATRVACLRSDDATPALFSPGSLTRIELGCRDVENLGLFVGVVTDRFWGERDWATPLRDSSHAFCMHGDGRFFFKKAEKDYGMLKLVTGGSLTITIGWEEPNRLDLTWLVQNLKTGRKSENTLTQRDKLPLGVALAACLGGRDQALKIVSVHTTDAQLLGAQELALQVAALKLSSRSQWLGSEAEQISMHFRPAAPSLARTVEFLDGNTTVHKLDNSALVWAAEPSFSSGVYQVDLEIKNPDASAALCIGLAYSLPNETRTIAWTVESVRAPIDAVCIDRDGLLYVRGRPKPSILEAIMSGGAAQLMIDTERKVVGLRGADGPEAYAQLVSGEIYLCVALTHAGQAVSVRRCVHQAQSVSLEEISVIAAGDEPAEPVLKSGNTEGSREFEAKVQSFLKTAAVTKT